LLFSGKKWTEKNSFGLISVAAQQGDQIWANFRLSGGCLF
jgi:hypothetical protein